MNNVGAAREESARRGLLRCRCFSAMGRQKLRCERTWGRLIYAVTWTRGAVFLAAFCECRALATRQPNTQDSETVHRVGAPRASRPSSHEGSLESPQHVRLHAPGVLAHDTGCAQRTIVPSLDQPGFRGFRSNLLGHVARLQASVAQAISASIATLFRVSGLSLKDSALPRALDALPSSSPWRGPRMPKLKRFHDRFVKVYRPWGKGVMFWEFRVQDFFTG